MEMERKGDCYADALKRILYPNDGEFEGWLLVHGYPTLRRPPWKRFGHAWLESSDGEWCWDPNTGAKLPTWLYYHLGNIEKKHCTWYGPAEAGILAVRTGHWGPWEEAPCEAL